MSEAVIQLTETLLQQFKRQILAITVFDEEMVYAVNGRALVQQDPIQNVPFTMYCVDMKIEAVQNSLLYGVQWSSVPQFVNIYDQRAAEKLDEQVFSAMKKSLVRDHWAFCCLFSDVCCCMY